MADFYMQAGDLKRRLKEKKNNKLMSDKSVGMEVSGGVLGACVVTGLFNLKEGSPELACPCCCRKSSKTKWKEGENNHISQ